MFRSLETSLTRPALLSALGLLPRIRAEKGSASVGDLASLLD